MSEQVTSGRKGRTAYSSVKLHAKRGRKRQEAAARDREYQALSTKAKLAQLPLGGESKREIARLTARLKTEKTPATKTAPLTEAQKSVKAVKRAKASIANQ